MTTDVAGLRVVVTGGAGFVGSWLCERLLADGAEVVCVDSLVTGRVDNIATLRAHPRFSFVRADICEGIPVRGRVDWVMHLASPASPVHYLRLPLETLRVGSIGTSRALDLAIDHGARFLLASTSEVYGDPLEHPQHESYWGNVNPLGPRSVYDEAKRFAEATTAAYRREHGADTVVARIFNTYGPRMSLEDGRVVTAFVRQALEGRPLTVAGDGSQTRSLCFVADTVDGLVRLAASGLPGPVNIGGDREITVLALAHTVRDLVGSTSEVDFVELPQDDPTRRRPDLTRARTLLGWEPTTPTEEGLRRTMEWIAGELGLDRERLVATAEAAGPSPRPR
ncbi:UDP-glucuronic acid decarboxylase family protein [Nocardioides aurantiacus]|uniref:UDP-glucuronic acid decarboxylase family protein n=1 Tax=Nocardioides aurantiacus TaxID=86796 RepID=UPI00403F02B8